MFQVSQLELDVQMDIDQIFQTALHAQPAQEDSQKEWKVLLRLPSKVIRFTLTDKECREPRTISWLNSLPQRTHSADYQPGFAGFRHLNEVEIIMEDKKVLSYPTFNINLADVIFVHDEYHAMGDSRQTQAIDARRITPDGVEIITKSIGDTSYHLNGHVYHFKTSLGQNQFIAMTNVLLRKLEDSVQPAPQKAATKFLPFLALNRDYIEGFSIIFQGSRGVR